MRDWGWEDRAEWTAQDTGRYITSERRVRTEVTEDRPVWGEWERAVEEYLGELPWEWYVQYAKAVESRRKEKEWSEKVKVVIPMILEMYAEIGCTETVWAAVAWAEGRKPKSRWHVAGAEMVSSWRTMTVDEIIAHVRARILAERHPEQGEVVEVRVASTGTIPQNNPFAALKGKF